VLFGSVPPGKKEYRSNLTQMYFPSLDPRSGKLLEMALVPMQIRRFQTIHTSPSDSQWIMDTLNREGKRFGTTVESVKRGEYKLVWN
jgi:poly-gamma-glutamate synthesis protein (capsule biosynthesis protein)